MSADPQQQQLSSYLKVTAPLREERLLRVKCLLMEALRLAGDKDFMLPVALSLTGDINGVIVKVDEHLNQLSKRKEDERKRVMEAIDS